MLRGVLEGQPYLRGRYYVKHDLVSTYNLIHPVPGAATWTMSNSLGGGLSGNVFTPSSSFYGLCHVVGVVGGVRCLVSIQIVPDNEPKYCPEFEHYRLCRTANDEAQNNWLTPKFGAVGWDAEVDNPLGWDSSLWLPSVKRTVALTVVGSSLQGVVSPASADFFNWICLKRDFDPNYPTFIRDPAATQTTGGNTDVVSFNVPGLTTTSHILLAMDQWDCWIMPGVT